MPDSTYTRGSRFTQSISLIVAGVSVLVASLSVLYAVKVSHHQSQCSAAYATANIKAQKLRLDRTQQRDEKLKQFVLSIQPIVTGKPIDDADGVRLVSNIRKAVADYLKTSDQLDKARIVYDYPTSACPAVKGITG